VAAGGYYGRRATRLEMASCSRPRRETIAKGDFNKGTLWLRRPFRPSGSVEAVRMMATSPSWRSSRPWCFGARAPVQLQPHSLTNRLLLARAATLHREYATAKKALDGVDDAGQKTAGLPQGLRGILGRHGQYTNAETHFAEAMRLEPTNPVPQLNSP